MPTGVLMIGSVPGASRPDVFTRLTTALPGRLQAVPDGETGERWNYIGGQLERFSRVARRNKLGGIPLPGSGYGLPTFTLRDIEPISYDEAVLSSYAECKRLGDAREDRDHQLGVLTTGGHLMLCDREPVHSSRRC
jgi:hypothetical protein